jgi:hypothetical protein
MEDTVQQQLDGSNSHALARGGPSPNGGNDALASTRRKHRGASHTGTQPAGTDTRTL